MKVVLVSQEVVSGREIFKWEGAVLSCKQFCCQVKEIGENEIISLLAPSVVLTLGRQQAGPRPVQQSWSTVHNISYQRYFQRYITRTQGAMYLQSRDTH